MLYYIAGNAIAFIRERLKSGDIAFNGKPISELRSVTCHMGSHSVSCHSTQVNAPRLNPSQINWFSIYLPREGWKAELA